MIFNHKKSVILICRSKYMKNVYPVFTLNGKIIDESDTVRYLGHILLYNTLFSREEIFAKSEFEIFSREDIFANILFTRKYLPAKISSRENIFPRKYLPANCFRVANMQASRPRLCGLLFHNLEAPT